MEEPYEIVISVIFVWDNINFCSHRKILLTSIK